MTTETSNALGETYTFDMIEDAWGDAVPLTKPYFNRFRARLEALRQSAAPPPAAEGVQAGEVADAEVWLFKGTDGAWHTFHNEQHRLDTIADGRWEVRKFAALTGERNG